MSGRGIKGLHDAKRAAEMCDLFRAGNTLQKIGESYGVTRERVRQIIKKFEGVVGKNGGICVTAKRKKIVSAAERDARYLRKYGCTFYQYKSVFILGEKDTHYKSASGAYRCQRNSANRRGVEWKLTFWQWWMIWQESGKWDLRGIGQGRYCMARHNDIGAYEFGNVFICLCTENNSNRKEKKSGLPIGVSKKTVKNYVAYVAQKMIGGKSYRIGTFKTPEAAGMAYQSFSGHSS